MARVADGTFDFGNVDLLYVIHCVIWLPSGFYLPQVRKESGRCVPMRNTTVSPDRPGHRTYRTLRRYGMRRRAPPRRAPATGAASSPATARPEQDRPVDAETHKGLSGRPQRRGPCRVGTLAAGTTAARPAQRDPPRRRAGVVAGVEVTQSAAGVMVRPGGRGRGCPR